MDPKFEQRTEPYRFDCGRCGSVWTVSYEIREASDPEGEEYELFLVGGMPMTPPRAGIGCPTCGNDKVVGRPQHEASPRARARAERPGRVPRPHQVGGVPLVVLRREPLPGGQERITLSVATTWLVLQHGPGSLPERVRARVETPVTVQVAGTSGQFGAAHWTDGQARLIWEHGGRWYELAGHTGRELLVGTANDLMADLDGLGIAVR